MANTMEEEIDVLDLAKNFTGESGQETEQPQETPADKPEDKPEDKPDEPKVEGKEETGAEPPKEEPDKTPEPPKEPFGQKGHTPRGVQERINELSRSNRELKEQNARILAELDKFKSSLPKEPEKGRDAFATDEEWVDYRAGIKAREMVEKMRAEERERAEMDEAKASFAKSEGVELTDEQLKKISGGDWDGEETVSYTQKCISCGNVNQWYEGQTEPLYCQFCGQQLLKLP